MTPSRSKTRRKPCGFSLHEGLKGGGGGGGLDVVEEEPVGAAAAAAEVGVVSSSQSVASPSWRRLLAGFPIPLQARRRGSMPFQITGGPPLTRAYERDLTMAFVLAATLPGTWSRARCSAWESQTATTPATVGAAGALRLAGLASFSCVCVCFDWGESKEGRKT